MEQIDPKLILSLLSAISPIAIAVVSYFLKNMFENIKKQELAILESIEKLSDKIEHMRTYQHIVKTEVAEIKTKINEMDKWLDLTELTKVSGKVHFLFEQTAQLPKLKNDVDVAHDIIRDLKLELNLLKRNP